MLRRRKSVKPKKNKKPKNEKGRELPTSSSQRQKKSTRKPLPGGAGLRPKEMTRSRSSWLITKSRKRVEQCPLQMKRWRAESESFSIFSFL